MADAPIAKNQGSKLGLMIKRGLVFGVPALVVAGTFVMMGSMSAMAPQPEEKEEVVEALPVVVATAEDVSVALSVRSQGEVRARSEVTLAPEVSGRISYVSPSFVAGGHFRKGDVLLRLDARDFELRVVQASAAVAQAETNLRRQKSEAESARIEAEALGIDNVSGLALREPQVAEAQAQLSSANAALDEARLQLSKTVIRAPFDGRVVNKSVDLGGYVGPGTALARMFSTDVVEIPIALTDNDLDILELPIGYAAKTGPEVQLSAVVAGQVRNWKGDIVRTASGFDPDTRVLFAYVEVKDPFGAGADNGIPLATGLYVSAEIEGPEAEMLVSVPRTALRGTDKVYVVDDERKLRIVSVDVASSDRERALIQTGLSNGDRVITSPVRSPADGMEVKPVDDPSKVISQQLIASAETTQRED